MKNKLKILELTNYTSGICGVWQRAKQESIELSKLGYDIKIFSSNFIKGSNQIASSCDKLDNIEISRFSAKKLGGESFMTWKFEEEALKYSPDIIIAHSYRHLHTQKALKISQKLKKNGKKCKVFLVTHAPFGRTSTRTFLQNLIVYFYDLFIGRITLNKFDKIIVITPWEIPYLEKLGVKRDRIVYIPNGIPEEFFKLKKQSKEENKILFLGRISPIKNLEVVIKALELIKDKEIIFQILGPAEEDYKNRLLELINQKNLNKRVIFSEPTYELKEKINKIDSCKIFILPSKTEGMPQSLIEAMARKKIVIGSDIISLRDIINNKKNGYLFNQGDEHSLAETINMALENKSNIKIGIEAEKSVKDFSWNKVIKKLTTLF